jgi:hypothetical protein
MFSVNSGNKFAGKSLVGNTPIVLFAAMVRNILRGINLTRRCTTLAAWNIWKYSLHCWHVIHCWHFVCACQTLLT